MYKELYTTPEMEIVEFEVEDVIICSFADEEGDEEFDDLFA